MAYKIRHSLSGNIPEKVTYIYGITSKLSNVWEDLEPDEDEKFETVIPVFISDANNLKTLETGRKWANPKNYWYTTEEEKKVKVKEITVTNEPLTGIRIIGLEERGNGGRAYKAISKEGYYFDLREDVLLDALIKEGISVGGILNGSYIWAKIGAQMKLIRIGSALHEAMLIADKRSRTPKLSSSKLEVGGVYLTKSGHKIMYLGKVDYYYLESIPENYKNRYGYEYPSNQSKIKAHNRKGEHLVIKIPDFEDSVKAFWKNFVDKGMYFYLDYKKSPGSFVEKIENFEFPNKNIMEDIRLVGEKAKNEREAEAMRYNSLRKEELASVSFSKYTTTHRPEEKFEIPEYLLSLDGKII